MSRVFRAQMRAPCAWCLSTWNLDVRSSRSVAVMGLGGAPSEALYVLALLCTCVGVCSTDPRANGTRLLRSEHVALFSVNCVAALLKGVTGPPGIYEHRTVSTRP